MSDVSGIPYMGPMGQGNFFAPQFSYNPQMTAGQIQSAYMPEVANNQNTLSQLYGAGANQGFGQQTANYAALGAAYGRAVPLSPGAMYMFSDTGQSAQAPAFNQGAINNFATGGGGFNFPSVPNYSGGIGGSYGLGEGLGSSGFNTTSLQNLFGNWNAPSQPSLDWLTLFSGGGGARADPYPGMAMPGGLNAPMSGSGLDWGGLFGGGAARADPYPGMAMPGGLGSPMVAPQQPPTDFGSLFGRGVGGTSGAPETPQPAAPSFDVPRSLAQPSLTDYGAPPTLPSFDWTKLFGGGGGGAATETTAPRSSSVFDTGAAPIIGTQDTGSLGGGAGIGGLDTGRAIGAPYMQAAEPQRGMLQEPVTEAYNPYFGVTSPYSPGAGDQGAGAPMDTRTGTLAPGGGLTAADLSEQARARLAELMNAPKEPGPDEIFAGDKPAPTEGQPAPEDLPGEAGRGGMVGRPDTERPAAAAADAPRPKVALGTTGDELGYLPGRGAQDLKGVNPRFAKALQEYAQQYNASQDQYDLVLRSGQLGRTKGEHAGGNAVDINLVDRRNGERLTDYQTRDPVVFKAYQDNANQFHQFLQQNYPDLAAQHRWGGYFSGPAGLYGAQDIMHHDIGGARHGMAGGSWQQGLNQQQADLYELPYGGGTKTPYPQFNFDWSNAPIKDVGPMPLTYKSPGGGSVYQYDPATGQKVNIPLTVDPRTGKSSMGELASRDFVPAASVERPAEAPSSESRVNQGQNVAPPPADIPDPRVVGGGFNALDAAAGPSGVEKAQTFLNRSLESILQQHSPENLGRAGFVMDIKQPLREALNGPFGGAILSGLQPKLGSVGLTQSDFTKAVADPRARFGGEFGGMGGELPSPGAFTPFEGFRPSADFENRTTEQLGRDQLAELQARGTSYEPGPEVAPTPLGTALGLGDLPLPTPAATFAERFTGEPAPAAAPTPAAPSTAGEYSIFDMPPGELNPYTGQAGPDPAFRYTSPYGYGGGIGTDFAGDQQVNQQKAEGELQFQRAPMVSQLEDNEGTRNKLFATMVDEMGTGASDQAYAAVAESLFNRAAAAGNFDELDKATFLGGKTKEEKYYEGQQGPGGRKDTTMGSAYLDKLGIVQKDPALQARLWEIVQQVAAGSNVSNFATDNASAAVARNALAKLATQGESFTTRSPDYGKIEGESFFRKDNPMGTTGRHSAEDFIGKGPQDATRAWYQNLVPSMRYPPY
jgi:hypothetical protein